MIFLCVTEVDLKRERNDLIFSAGATQIMERMTRLIDTNSKQSVR